MSEPTLLNAEELEEIRAKDRTSAFHDRRDLLAHILALEAQLKTAEERGRTEEREACAQVVDEQWTTKCGCDECGAAQHVANAIRNRGVPEADDV